MKFGEQLLAQLTPEWNSQYVNYEYMKDLLAKTVAEAPMSVNDNDNLLREQFFLHADKFFFQVRIIVNISFDFNYLIHFFSSIAKNKQQKSIFSFQKKSPSK
jgi:SPX domain protein involved in polyphosphate accumulation